MMKKLSAFANVLKFGKNSGKVNPKHLKNIEKDSSIDLVLLEKMLVQLAEAINKNVRGRDIVLVIGATGSGKSTLINHLQGVPLVEKRNELTNIKYVDVQSGFRLGRASPSIGHSMESHTLYPEVFVGKNGIVYCDTGGCVGENRGTTHSLITNIALKMITDAANSVKALFTVIETQVMDVERGNRMSKMLQRLSKILTDDKRFHNDIQGYFRTSIFFIFTKAEPGLQHRHIVGRLRQNVENLANTTNEANKEAKMMMELMLKNKSNIIIANLFDHGLSQNILINSVLESKQMKNQHFNLALSRADYLEYSRLILSIIEVYLAAKNEIDEASKLVYIKQQAIDALEASNLKRQQENAGYREKEQQTQQAKLNILEQLQEERPELKAYNTEKIIKQEHINKTQNQINKIKYDTSLTVIASEKYSEFTVWGSNVKKGTIHHHSFDITNYNVPFESAKYKGGVYKQTEGKAEKFCNEKLTKYNYIVTYYTPSHEYGVAEVEVKASTCNLLHNKEMVSSLELHLQHAEQDLKEIQQEIAQSEQNVNKLQNKLNDLNNSNSINIQDLIKVNDDAIHQNINEIQNLSRQKEYNNQKIMDALSIINSNRGRFDMVVTLSEYIKTKHPLVDEFLATYKRENNPNVAVAYNESEPMLYGYNSTPMNNVPMETVTDDNVFSQEGYPPNYTNV